MRIERVTDPAVVALGAALFDEPVRDDAARRFVESPTHHLLFAYDDDDRVVGFVTGVETTHPDKGTEMFLYELAVAPYAQGHGVGTSLTRALASLARERGCYGMWVGTDADNAAALAVYRNAGATLEEPFVMLTWEWTSR